MRATRALAQVCVLLIGLCGALGAGVGDAHAQPATTGAIRGQVVDHAGRGVAGLLVRVAGRREHQASTGADGSFALHDISPGAYELVVSPPDAAGTGSSARARLDVVAAMVTYVHARADDVGELALRVSAIDPLATGIAFVLDRRYVTDVPNAGRTSDAIAGAGPTGHHDRVGLAFADTSALDNRFTLDGVDTTRPSDHLGGTSVPTDWLDSIVITTGGAHPRLGRALGASVALTSRAGSDAVHGSVFASFSPAALEAGVRGVEPSSETIDVRAGQRSGAGVGFEVGGPLVRDRLWLLVGAAPQYARQDYARTIQRQVDCFSFAGGTTSECDRRHADGTPDVDPQTGRLIVEPVHQETRSWTTRSYPVLARIDGVLDEAARHTASVTALVSPFAGERPALRSAASTGRRVRGVTSDVGARWNGQLDRVRLQATLGWHRESHRFGALHAGAAGAPLTQHWGTSLEQHGTEDPRALAACRDGDASDPYPMITNCPVPAYATGGPGLLSREIAERRSAQLIAATELRALGTHALELGIDGERVSHTHAAVYSGGELFDAGGWRRRHQRALLATVEDAHGFDDRCRIDGTEHACRVLGGDLDDPSAASTTRSAAVGGYVRDAWRPRRDLEISAALRFDRQRVLLPDELQGQTVLALGEDARRFGVNALRFPINLSPRLGVAHDPTGEGRARLFAQWSRLIEALPTEVVSAQRSRHAWVRVSEPAGAVDGAYVPGGMHFDPALRPGQIDELVAGAEYEVMPALALGVAWQHRALGRAIEDVSADPSGFILTNPDGTQGSGVPAASRRYDAVILTASRRLSRLYLLASYVHARRHGTYPGPYGDEGGGDAGRTSPQFDRPDLVTGGVLALDRRHTLKLDASYPVSLGPSSALILGTRMRAQSGTPRSVTGEGAWGTQQLLPRGALGREEPLYAIDVRIGYRRQLGRGVSADVYVDVINLLDRQEPYNVDDRWTDFTQTTLPIRGGTYGDLIWLKARQRFGQPDEVVPAVRNRDYGRVRSRYSPRFATLGARLVF